MGLMTRAVGDKIRTQLLTHLTSHDFYWETINLAGGATISVSFPLRKKYSDLDELKKMDPNPNSKLKLEPYLFVPVTPQETMKIAAKLGYFPLTRAVADQMFNQATQVLFKRSLYPDMFNLIEFTKELETTAYGSQYGWGMAAGWHKLWVLSTHQSPQGSKHGAHKEGPFLYTKVLKPVNYGFVDKAGTPKTVVPGGKYLDKTKYALHQDVGNAHGGNHWDYSQLLQLMTNFKDPSNPGLDLKTALLQGHPAIWDEKEWDPKDKKEKDAKLSADQMPIGSVELPLPFGLQVPFNPFDVTVEINENGDIAINGIMQQKK